MDVSKLKVAELRAELTSRGLDSKGLKPVLVERLRKALEDEAEEAEIQEEETTEESNDPVQAEEPSQSEAANGVPDTGLQTQEKDEEAPAEEQASEPVAEKPVESEPVAEEPMESESVAEEPMESEPVDEKLDETSQPEQTSSEMPEQVPSKIEDTAQVMESSTNEEELLKPESPKKSEESIPVDSQAIKTEDSTTEAKEENGDSDGRKPSEKRSLSPVGNDEKRLKLDESKTEQEPDFDKTVVALDWYNSDLSLQIDTGRLKASPFCIDGFGYMWHGVRATYGMKSGKTFFEVTITEDLDLSHMEEAEPCPHAVRVGWSTDESGMTLGEEKNSWGFGGTGKASTNLKFTDYGKTFGKGDVIGSYLDFESDKVTISYTINGESQGTCFEIEKEEIPDTALFPHILTKNCAFKVNFGTEEPAFEPIAGYEFIGKVPLEDRVPGLEGPARKEDSEVIMMVGLPGSGKTTWVGKYVAENPKKRYNVLGTNCLIDKMKVMGLPRKRNYSGRWETLIEKCTKCLNNLLVVASKRRRNIIIDQTNVYPTAQRRKMRGFEAFQRRAVVICPTDEELKDRTQKREKLEGKDVPDRAVLEMKANYKLPVTGEPFNEVEFIELGKEEAEALVSKYNKEGEDAGFGMKQRPRGGYGQGKPISNRTTYNDRPRRDHYHDKGGYRGGWDRDRDRRGGYDRRDRGGRDHRDYRRDNRSGGPRDHRGGGGGGGYHRDRFNNRGGGGGNYNNYGGGWNDYKGQQRRPHSNQYGQQGGWDQNNQWGNNQGNWNNQSNYGQYGNYNQNYYGQQNQQPQSSTQSSAAPTQYWTNAYGQQGYNAGGSSYPQGGYGNQGYNYNQQTATPSAPQASTQPQSATSQQWNSYNQGYSYDQYNRK